MGCGASMQPPPTAPENRPQTAFSRTATPALPPILPPVTRKSQIFKLDELAEVDEIAKQKAQLFDYARRGEVELSVPKTPNYDRLVVHGDDVVSNGTQLGDEDESTSLIDHANIDQAIDSLAIDDSGRGSPKVPLDYLYESYEDLANYLTADADTDLERARAIFTWLASIDLQELEDKLDPSRVPDANTPVDYLLKIHWNMGNHAFIYAVLNRCVGIPCYVVNGVNKSAAYNVGEKIVHEDLEALWNAVLVEDEWRLVDVYWASMCLVGTRSSEWAIMDIDGKLVMDRGDGSRIDGERQHYVNEFFFLTDPEKFIYTHLPDEPVWQLLDDPVSLETFETQVYIRERFWELGMSLAARSYHQCVLRTINGEVEIYFDLPRDDSHKIKFRYQLHKQRKSTDGSMTYYPLNRYVLYQKTPSFVIYQARFPVEGRFKIDIFGLDKTKHEDPDLVCSYVIDCRKAKDPCNPLPDDPDIGWGPGEHITEVGLETGTHEAGVIETDDGTVEIRFGMKNALLVLQNLKHNELDDWLLKRHAAIRFEDDEMVIQIRLPQEGEYALKLFAERDGFEGDLPNVCNYLIRCNKDGVQPTPFPKLHEGILGKGNIADKLGVQSLDSNDNGIINSDDGKLRLKFQHSDDIDLVAELHHTDEDRRVMANDVRKTYKKGVTEFKMDLAEKGEYGVNIFARSKSDDKRLYHVHTYLVNVAEGQTKTSTTDKGKNEKKTVDRAKENKKNNDLANEDKKRERESTKNMTHKDPTDKTASGRKGVEIEKQSLTSGAQNNSIVNGIGRKPMSGRGRSSAGKGTPKSGKAQNRIERLRNLKSRAGRRKLPGEDLFLDQEEEVHDDGEEELTMIQLATAKEELEVKLNARERPMLVELRKKYAIEPPEEGHVITRVTDYDEIFKVKLPEYGEYRMDVYEQQENGAGLLHVVSYEIERDEDIEDEPDEPSEEELARRAARKIELRNRALRRQLRQAMSNDDIGVLERAITIFDESGAPDQKGDLPRAKRILTYRQINDRLTKAMQMRHLYKLEESIQEVEENGLARKLGLKLAMARKILERLRRIEKLRHVLRHLDQQIIAEIKSYASPPEQVHRVMLATFVLLGEDESKLTKDWNQIVVHMSKTGKLSLNRRVITMRIEGLDFEKVMASKRIISGLELEEIRDVSVGAATFYLWTRKIIEEAESRQAGRDPRTGRELNKVPNRKLNTLKTVSNAVVGLKKGRVKKK